MQAFSTQLFPANWLANSSKVALVHVLKLEATWPMEISAGSFFFTRMPSNCTEEKDGGNNTKTKHDDLVKENYI